MTGHLISQRREKVCKYGLYTNFRRTYCRKYARGMLITWKWVSLTRGSSYGNIWAMTKAFEVVVRYSYIGKIGNFLTRGTVQVAKEHERICPWVCFNAIFISRTRCNSPPWRRTPSFRHSVTNMCMWHQNLRKIIDGSVVEQKFWLASQEDISEIHKVCNGSRFDIANISRIE